MAAFLGSYLDTIHYPSSVRILLVGNQSFYLMENLRNYICQMLSFAPERVDYLPGYAWNSSLLRDIDYYTIFLTTEPEIALKNSRFRLIPIIMTNENREMLKSILEDCRKQIVSNAWRGWKESPSIKYFHTWKKLKCCCRKKTRLKLQPMC